MFARCGVATDRLAGQGLRHDCRTAEQNQGPTPAQLGGHARAGVRALAAVGRLVLVLGVVSEDVVARNGLEVHDAANLQLFTSHRSPMLIAAARLVTNLGSVAVLIPLALIAGLILWLRGARLVVAASPALSLGVAGFCATGFAKQLVGRSRPPTSIRLVSETVVRPSGHSTDSAALYRSRSSFAVVLFRRPIARALTIGFAGLGVFAIGVSRLILGVHWPTDVLAGWALGVIVAVVVTTTALLISRQVPTTPSNGDTSPRRWWLWVRRLSVIQRSTMHGRLEPRVSDRRLPFDLDRTVSLGECRMTTADPTRRAYLRRGVAIALALVTMASLGMYLTTLMGGTESQATLHRGLVIRAGSFAAFGRQAEGDTCRGLQIDVDSSACDSLGRESCVCTERACGHRDGDRPCDEEDRLAVLNRRRQYASAHCPFVRSALALGAAEQGRPRHADRSA